MERKMGRRWDRMVMDSHGGRRRRVVDGGTVREPKRAFVDVHDSEFVADLARNRQLHRRREETGQVELERLLLDPQRARPNESADVALLGR